MTEVSHENICNLLKLIALPDFAYVDGANKMVFTKSETIEKIRKLIDKKLHENSKKFKDSTNHSLLYDAATKKYIKRIPESDRYILFFVIYGKLFCTATNALKSDCNEVVRVIKEGLNIEEKNYAEFEAFYKTTVPLTDKENSIYFICNNCSQLIKSRGVNVINADIPESEIVQIKYFPSLQLFGVKKYLRHRPNNSITENYRVLEIGLLSENSICVGKKDYKTKDLLTLIDNYMPYQSIRVNATENTPQIVLDADEDNIVIKGTSTPLSPTNYFDPIYIWMKNYEQFGGKKLSVHIELEYYNTYTSKFLIKLVTLCRQLFDNGRVVNVNWYYWPDDDEMLEFGKHLQKVFRHNFKYIALNEKTALTV